MADAGAVTAAPGGAPACWFCRRGRCGECMGNVPVAGGSAGPHDCSFDTEGARCGCAHRP